MKMSSRWPYEYSALQHDTIFTRSPALIFVCVFVASSLYFAMGPSVFLFLEHGKNAVNVNQSLHYEVHGDVKDPFDPELLALAEKVVQEHYTNSYVCQMQPVTIKCLVAREQPYVYPYFCKLKYTKHPDVEPVPFFAPFYESTSNTVFPVPLVIGISHQNTTEELVSGETTCPCNCRIPCREPQKNMRLLEGKTPCGDCKCLYSDINCDCLDKYDLEFRRLDENIKFFLSLHPLYQIKTNITTFKNNTIVYQVGDN